MKNIKYILASLSILVLAFSCQKQDDYVPGEPELADSKGVFFQAPTKTMYEFAPELPGFNITATLERPNADGALNNIPIVVSNDLFTVSEASFADGQLTTDITITLSPEAEAGKRHEVEISITDPKFVLVYGLQLTSVKYVAQIVKWNVISTNATYYDRVFVWGLGANAVSTTVTVEERDDMPGLLRITQPYTAEYGARLLAGTANDGLGDLLVATEDLIINATNPNKAWIADYFFEQIGWAMMTYSPEVGFGSGTGYGKWENGKLTLRPSSLIVFDGQGYYFGNQTDEWLLLDCHL